jgi:hypothetical protein
MSTVEPSSSSLVPNTPPQVPANVPKRRGRPPKQRPPEQPPTATEPEEPAEFTVVARDPNQMAAAQARLIGWAQRRRDALATEASELEQNFRAAEIARINTRAIERQLTKLKREILFYEKLKLAREAGYTLVPHMDAQVFAVRTRLKHPSGRRVESESLPVGAGRYVGPVAHGVEYDAPSHEGRSVRYWKAIGLREELDFPFALAAYEVVDATRQALLDKVFDELAAVTGRSSPVVGTPTRKPGDPIVIGRIRRPSGYQYAAEARYATFLIAWFVDTRFLWR